MTASPYLQPLPTLGVAERESQSLNESKLIEKVFSDNQGLEDDFTFLRQRWMPGTCEWILAEPNFKLWLDDASRSCIAWLNAPPASGKSILSTYVVNHVHNLGHYCQYFMINFRDSTKRSPAGLLKSIGLQMAEDIPEFRQKIVKLSREGVTLERKDARFTWHKIFTSVLSQIVLPSPLYWVIDALDESESPEFLLEVLQDIPTFQTPVHVFITSRRTESLFLAFERLSVSVPVDVIQKEDHVEITSDIRKYVESEMRLMRGTKEVKLQVRNSILHRANGNFLWVRLVLEELLRCHTQQAVMQVLEEVPAGMGALYQRMELSITTSLKEADRVLANALLMWIVCAHRPLTLKELSQGLSPDFPEFLDLRRTIQDVCGHFVVVDRSLHVVMIHKTARDYLTQTPNLCFFINEKVSQEELFVKTTSFLLRPELRSKLGRNQQVVRSTEPFLLYAVVSFPHHLRQAATVSERVKDQLVNFLKGPSVLTWIHSVALFRQLEVLVTTAQMLNWFSSLNRKLHIEKHPLLHRPQDMELFDLWATDLVKIVAKFGRHLLDDPVAIYKIIPPLCPQNSIMCRQFGGNENQTLSVTRISNATWNDCLARVSLHNGAKALKINCAGRHIAVLSSTGPIVLWDSVSFEMTCTLHHAELITEMCFNSTCDKLVSCGFRTIRIWAIPSGQLVFEAVNPADSKALAVTFAANDTKVLVASDDRAVRHLYVNAVGSTWHNPVPDLLLDESPVEGALITSPSFMAFNSDASQIAVAYRGYPLSVWATNETRLIGRCKRVVTPRADHPPPSVSWMAVDRIAWSPVAEQLVGLYKDGCVFKWSPSTGENQEVHPMADEIQISPDGKLFLTSDSRGNVKIWSLAHFAVIYQLSSEHLVMGLAFSPDCKRFYDLRGSSVNAWEPNCLLRFSDNGEVDSDTANDYHASTSMPHVSEAWVEPIDPICALAAAPDNQLYCMSHENGTVHLFDKTKGHLLVLSESVAFLTTDHLTWSGDGCHVAAADLGGNITVKRLHPPVTGTATAEFGVQSLFAAKSKPTIGGIHQILLNSNSTKLLIVSQDAGQIWSTETGSLVFSGLLEKGETRKWMNLPGQRDLLLGVGPRDLRILHWEDLTEVATLQYREERFHSGDRPSLDADESTKTTMGQLSLNPSDAFKEDDYVSRAMLTQDGEHILVEMCKLVAQGRSMKRLVAFETSLLARSRHLDSPALPDCLELSNEVMTRIEVALGILPDKTLVFLDKDLWMCTLRMHSTRQLSNLQRHYFIPRDWAGTESLEQCCLLQDGTFLFPKDGEVAVITSNLGAGSW